MKIRRSQRPNKRDTARRVPTQQERATAYVAGLRAAAAWFETYPEQIPMFGTTIDLPIQPAETVREFAKRHGLAIEQWVGAIVCTIHLGPIKIQAFGSEPNATEALTAAAQEYEERSS